MQDTHFSSGYIMPAAPNQFIPDFYDNLDQTLGEAWRAIGRGTVDRRSPMHTPAVATTGLDGSPRMRTVVLRQIDIASRTLRFHTDRRSEKFKELKADPRACLMAYDPTRKIQVRLNGTVVLHTADEVAALSWSQSRPMSQVCYQQNASPGTPVLEPFAPAPPGAGGYENFVVVRFNVAELEWLYLAAQGHRRARFTWHDGIATQSWLAP